ncbi:MAG: thiol:disulfide interchange protein DsbA/DsbL [Gammaproteobacteria bacterium]|nr:thiol:disulfide interchange protein DsbA/DsbL [Gammaproteobacteria bacterium]
MKKIALIFCALFMLAPLATVSAAEFKEGVQYIKLADPQPTSTGDKVEVMEFFWYGCPHCFRFEPFVERLVKQLPANAQFVRTPAMFRATWELHARAYYAAEILGVLEKVHKPMFNALHLEQRTLETDEQITKLFVEQGVDKESFTKTFRSFAVETRIRRAKTLAERYNLDGVPAVIVNGKYMVNGRTAGGNAQMLQVIEYLVKQESR